MNKMTEFNNEISMTSREIAEQTGKEHRNVRRDVKRMLLELYGKEDMLNYEHIFKDSYGREQKCYRLPKREVLVLVSGYSIPLRAKIVDRLEELEQRKSKTLLPDFSNPAEAARAWAIEYEEKQAALLQIVEDKPKVDYYKNVLDTGDTYTVTQIAKENEMTAIQLNIILKNEKIQFKQSGQWLLYQKYQDMGLVKTRTHIIERSNGDKQNRHSTTWTEKGREFIHDLLETI
ncbi:MAG: phage regulatory protein/antirepressor Ant [Candidatus Cloacimonadota bacterium]|nr:phage regulatory protein/antirepressor Ant [Candidatus Cloacimonadota bacterium]